MNWLIENWYMVVTAIMSLILCLIALYWFFSLPGEEQKKKVQEWLIWACIEAERALQSGTGQLKLRQVYNEFLAIESFKWIARIVTFETFSEWVSLALKSAKNMLINNPDLAKYVYGEGAEFAVEKLKEQTAK